ncbi:hypothetical protein ACRALDRAFT_207786 [Sodiomyces alcalophilus JCM 7366]|uniref:uncharacterized protein n=1 Tax=Sodiomyces alcalophilus JCM 7366 TaxID=591952 RepID=UPI0039B6A6B6
MRVTYSSLLLTHCTSYLALLPRRFMSKVVTDLMSKNDCREIAAARVGPARTRISGSGVGSFSSTPPPVPHVGPPRLNPECFAVAFKKPVIEIEEKTSLAIPVSNLLNLISSRFPLTTVFSARASPPRLNSHNPSSTMRLPYVPNPPQPANEEEEAIVARIAARRAPRPLQPLDLALLHSPPVADGWNSFLGAVRTRTTIPADLRELAISRIAVINRAWYEWIHHAPLAVAAGVSQEAMDWLKAQSGDLAGLEDGPKIFNEKQWAVLLLADEMTRNVHVADETFGKVKALFSDKEVVEIVTTVKFPQSSAPTGSLLHWTWEREMVPTQTHQEQTIARVSGNACTSAISRVIALRHCNRRFVRVRITS